MEKQRQDELPPKEREPENRKRNDNGMLVALMTAAGLLLGYILGKMIFDMPALRFVAAMVVGGVVGGAFSVLLKR